MGDSSGKKMPFFSFILVEIWSKLCDKIRIGVLATTSLPNIKFPLMISILVFPIMINPTKTDKDMISLKFVGGTLHAGVMTDELGLGGRIGFRQQVIN